ncbi:MAG: iron-containing alcohol dehydrogenase [Limnohabitans sp.]|nr:MAG: iron-containing alcohol dehydrogenase [Limnohabitans sp.]
MGFMIQTPTQILFGRGMKDRAADAIAAFGPRGVLVHGANPARADWLAQDLRAKDCTVATLPCTEEPTQPILEAALVTARAFAPDWVVALGGGAVIDMGKALAALIPSPTPLMDHLEVVGRGLPLTAAPLPFIALPTTAGTGAEVTKNAVIGLPDHRRKVSLRDDRMLARLAIVDPSLTDHCPWKVTFASGLDAVVQVIEPYLSTRANDFSDAIAHPAIVRGLTALQRLSQAEESTARDELAWVSLCGGLALANAGLGAVHGLAGPIGGMCPAPHGAVCAVLLGPALEMNRRRADQNAQATHRLGQVCTIIAQALGGSAETAPQTVATWVSRAGLEGLTAQGLALADHANVAEAALLASSMKSNPVPLTKSDLMWILSQAAP